MRCSEKYFFMKQQDNHWLLPVNCSNPAAFYQSVIIDFDLLWIYPLQDVCLHSCLWVQIWNQLTFTTVGRRDEEEKGWFWSGIRVSRGHLCPICLAPACSWQVVCLCMTHVYGIWLIKGLSWQLNLDIKITTVAQKKRGPLVISNVCASSDI